MTNSWLYVEYFVAHDLQFNLQLLQFFLKKMQSYKISVNCFITTEDTGILHTNLFCQMNLSSLSHYYFFMITITLIKEQLGFMTMYWMEEGYTPWAMKITVLAPMSMWL